MIAGLIVSGSQQEELQAVSFGWRFNFRFTGLRLNRKNQEYCQFSKNGAPDMNMMGTQIIGKFP